MGSSNLWSDTKEAQLYFYFHGLPGKMHINIIYIMISIWLNKSPDYIIPSGGVVGMLRSTPGAHFTSMV